jgi:tetratricopeptide (TPR) repeat protein
MSDHEKCDDRNLTRSSLRDLQRVGAANPLLARGLADLDQTQEILRQVETCAVYRQNAFAHYIRGTNGFITLEYIQSNEELEEAIRLFNEVIRLSPNDRVAYRHRGKAYWCKSVLCIASEDDELLQASCTFNLTEREYYDKAIQDFNEAIRLNPNDALSYIERGEAQCWASSYEQGIEDLNEAIRLDPSNAAWYALRGRERYDKQQYDKAILDFNEAIRLNASDQHEVLIVFTELEPVIDLCAAGCAF